MRVGRLVLVVATLVAILVFPLVLKDAVQAFKLPSAYAAPTTADAGGRVYQNGNNNDNDDNDDGNNDDDDDDDDNNNNNNESEDNENESGDNDNVVCYENLNSNEEVPCDFDDNGNDNYYAPPPPPAAPAPAPSSPAADRRCFSAGETGEVKLMLSGGSVVIRVVSPGLPQGAWIELAAVNPSSVPAPSGGATLLDSMVWRMDSGSGCDGGGAGQITGDVNLGIPYHVSADKSKLQIVRLEGGQWVEVNTVPDPSPSNPYISSTVRTTGTYAVIQKP